MDEEHLRVELELARRAQDAIAGELAAARLLLVALVRQAPDLMKLSMDFHTLTEGNVTSLYPAKSDEFYEALEADLKKWKHHTDSLALSGGEEPSLG